MNKRILSATIALILTASLTACGNKDEAPVTDTAVNVTVATATIGDIASTVNYTGDIKSESSASVSPKASGTVSRIYAEVGDYVKQGSVLFTLDSSSYTLAYNQAKAAVKSAEAAYNNAIAAYNNVKNGSNAQTKVNMNQSISNAQSNYDTALDNYNRQKALFDIGAISQVALDSAKTTLDNAKLALDTAKASAQLNTDVIAPQSEASAKAGVEQATAAVAQAKAAADIAANNVANCTVKAPISGYVASRNIQIGQMASQGMEAFSIKGADDLEVEINVTEAVIGHISVGSPANISIKSADMTDIQGTVKVVGNAKNDMTGMYTVKIAVPDADDKIKVGMIADVVITTDTAEKVLAIPQNSILTDNGETYVYVAEDNKAVKRTVTTGVASNDMIEITSGLTEGDTVICDGKEFLTDTNNTVNITAN